MDFLRMIVKVALAAWYRLKHRIVVEGIRNLPTGTGYILFADHIDLNDPLIIGSNLPHTISFMAKRELFKNKLLGGFLRFVGAFPVDREGNDISAIKNSFRVLKEGKALLIFAEGTRNKNRDNKPLPVKPGAMMIAQKSGVPVVPVMIDYNGKFFSKAVIRFYPPVQVTKEDDIDEVGKRLMEMIYKDMTLYLGG